MADRLLVSAASLFAASTVFSTVVAAREPHLPGEPLGVHVPGSVPLHLALGLGSGVAAPWPMPVLATWAAWRGQPGSDWPARTVATLGAMVLAGTLVEPASWGLRPRSTLAKATVPLHLLCGAAMFLAGTAGSRPTSPMEAGAGPDGS
jgi:hypothetical protein